MAAMSLVEVMDNYTKGRPWEWGRCDCIGLLFHVVNYYAKTPQLRSDYIPMMDYEESVRWLTTKFNNPLVPYKRLMIDAGLREQEYPIGPQVILVHGGMPLKATTQDEWYPVDPVPGIVFQSSAGSQFAMMRSGLLPVSLTSANRRVHRYRLVESG